MITCPNCSHPVREDQRFCGNCGIDVQATLAAQQAEAAANEPQPLPYAYPQQAMTSYGGYDLRRESDRSPVANRFLIVGVLMFAVACAFCCGILFGFEVLSGYFPPSAGPRPTPTREATLLFQPLMSLFA